MAFFQSDREKPANKIRRGSASIRLPKKGPKQNIVCHETLNFSRHLQTLPDLSTLSPIGPLPITLRKANKLWIPWASIRPNIVFRKSSFGVNTSRLIEIDPPILHDLLDFPFACVI